MIRGDFDGVLSVKQLGDKKAATTAGGHLEGVTFKPSFDFPIVCLNPHGTKLIFRTVSELEADVRAMNVPPF